MDRKEHSGGRFRRHRRRHAGNAVPLTNLCEGESATVAFTRGGYGLVRRLAEMGLTPGTTIKILRRGPFRGPLEIEVRGVSLALGHGVASRVFVKPLNMGNKNG